MRFFLSFLSLFFLSAGGVAEEPSFEEQVKVKIQEKISEVCEKCGVEIHFDENVKKYPVGKVISVHSDRWKGKVSLIIKTKGDHKVQIPVDIRWMDYVAIARKNIRHGSAISIQDINLVYRDVTFIKIPYARTAEQIEGFIGKRAFRRGQMIDESLLKKPHIVRYGQPVKLMLEKGSLSVIVSAKAKGSGAIGDRIPVFIPKTKKKLMAKIVQKDMLRIE